MITFNHMFNNKLIMWSDLIIWLSKFSSVSVHDKLNNRPWMKTTEIKNFKIINIF